MKDNIFERIFIDEDFDSMNNLVRFNGVKRIKDETVAHHSFIVTWFTRILVEGIFQQSDYDLKLKIVTYAIWHDGDEMLTGDIIHSFKYNDYNGEELRNLIKDFCTFKINKKFEGDDEISVMLRDNMLGNIDEYGKLIVKVADWLSALFYLKKEIALGNISFEAIKEYGVKKFKESINKCIFELNKVNYISTNKEILEELLIMKF